MHSQQSSDSNNVCMWEGAAELSAAPTTPSLLYNNLTESNGLLAYCSGSRVSVVHLSRRDSIPEEAENFVHGEQAASVASVELKHHRDAFATSALIVPPPPEVSSTICKFPSGRPCTALVVATTATVDFFELPEPGRPSGALLVHTTNLTETPVNPLARIMSRGLVTLPSKTSDVTVLTGTATGVILMHTIQFRKATGDPEADSASPHFSVVSGPSMQTPCSSITCVAVPSRSMQQNYNVARWLCADDSGCICVYERSLESLQAASPKKVTVPDGAADGDTAPDDADHVDPVSAAPSTCSALGWNRVALFAGTGVPCTGAAFLPDPLSGSKTPDYIVAGYTSGHVRLLSLVTNSIVAEIAAHSRSITALAVHPSLPYVVSVAEDAWVRVWSLQHSITKPLPSGSGRHGRDGSSGSSDGFASADANKLSSRMQKFDVTQQWSAFMPFFLWTGVCILPRSLPSSSTIVHDISVVAYDLGAIFTFHAKPASPFAAPKRLDH